MGVAYLDGKGESTLSGQTRGDTRRWALRNDAWAPGQMASRGTAIRRRQNTLRVSDAPDGPAV